MDYGHTASSRDSAGNQPIFSPADTPEQTFSTPDFNTQITPTTPSPELTSQDFENITRAAERDQVFETAPNPIAAPTVNTTPEIMDPIDAVKRSISFNEADIKTGEKLSDSGIKEIDRQFHELDKTGDIAAFTKTVREGMMPANIKNSYGANANWGKAA